MPPPQESVFIENAHPILRYHRFARTMIEDLDRPELMAEFKKQGLAYGQFKAEEAEKFAVTKGYNVGGLALPLSYEVVRPFPDIDYTEIKYPIKPFVRRGDVAPLDWRNLYLEHPSPTVSYRPDRKFFKCQVRLPKRVSFPRVVHCRKDPVKSEFFPVHLDDWQRQQKVNGLRLPEFTYYDGERYEGYFETWTQLGVVFSGTDSRFDYSQDDDRLGGLRVDGMLTSPSTTYLKLGLWKEEPAHKNQVPTEEILFRSSIPRSSIDLSAYPENLVETWNARLKRIELKPSPPSPPLSSLPLRFRSLNHRQRFNYGLEIAGGDESGRF